MLGLAPALAVLVLSAPANAQEPGPLSEQLVVGVRCTEVRAAEDLAYRIKRARATPEEISAALRELAGNTNLCAPVRSAALALAGEEATAPIPAPVEEESRSAEAARAIASQLLAEAERRAAQLKFEVGPPPRNLTRGRIPRP